MIIVIQEEIPSDHESDIEEQCPDAEDTTDNADNGVAEGLAEYADDFEEYDSSEVRHISGLPLSEQNIWKKNFFQGQGKVRELCGWPGKFGKDLESRGKVREFEINGYGRQSSENYFFPRGERLYFVMR